MKRYDLNLLVALNALLRERSVSGAARRIGVGQPAMSAALARLRALFDDPLLVRSASGMEPTPRGRELADPLAEALDRLGLLIEPVPLFDPTVSDRTLRISGGDYVGMTLLPGLVSLGLTQAPSINLRFRFLEKDAALTAVDSGEVDLALMVLDVPPPRFDSEVVLSEGFVGAARRGHPIMLGPVDAAAFSRFDHLLVTERGDATGCVDRALGELGLSRRIAVTVPSAALVADLLDVTDLIATISRRVGLRLKAAGRIDLFDLPVATPAWNMRAVWSKRDAADPAIQWLRDRLRDVAASAGS